MSDLTDIIERCSQWELDALRAIGLDIPANVRGKEIEDVFVPNPRGWLSEPKPKPLKLPGRPGRPEGSGGRGVWSNCGDFWPAIRVAARCLETSQQRIRKCIARNSPCCGLYLSDVSAEHARRKAMRKAA